MTFSAVRIAGALAVILVLSHQEIVGQNRSTPSDSAPLRVATARRYAAEVKIDGRLDEPVWKEIEPITDFTQTEPDEGQPATERTEVRIFYDERKLYFGFRCFDSEPSRIVARLDAHDARTFSDSVDILLDTFHDLRTGYFFSVNARGVQFDALVSETTGGGSGFDLYDGTWDGLWESAATIDEFGWVAEIAIPFKILRFPRTSPQTWGLNLGREIVRKNESVRWYPVARFDRVMKPSKSGILRGLEEIRPGRDLEIIPFTLQPGRFRTTIPTVSGYRPTAGVDVRYGLTANLKANLTVNPDFAQTEADEINITLSRFELFFPEKRAFFVEGANFFRTPLQLFFSRRVGLRVPDGSEQRIAAGAKITGKIGRYNLGVLEARTRDQFFLDPESGERRLSPGANFFVLRVQRDIFEKSALGFITVNRDQPESDFSHSARAHGIDLALARGRHITFSSQVAVSQNPGVRASLWQQAGATAEFRYDSDRFEYEVEAKYLGRDFDVSGIGFEPETGRVSGQMSFTYKPFLNRFGIRQIFLEPNYDHVALVTGEHDDSGADLRLRVQFKNFWSARAVYSYDRVRFHEFVDQTRLDRMRVYIMPRVILGLTTNENRPVWLSLQVIRRKFVDFRDNYYGRLWSYELNLNARLAGRTKLELRGLLFREYFMNGKLEENRSLILARIGHQFTPKLRARVLAQFNNDNRRNQFNLNSLLSYDFTARSALAIGYNAETISPEQPFRIGRELFVKFSYVLAF
ncbi:MAG TPA: DUF5916 domain-containing protein [Blastocatellia bacterium]|nr:DUF5916 domain-containing protein [Blastocatellia bacterium]